MKLVDVMTLEIGKHYHIKDVKLNKWFKNVKFINSEEVLEDVYSLTFKNEEGEEFSIDRDFVMDSFKNKRSKVYAIIPSLVKN